MRRPPVYRAAAVWALEQARAWIPDLEPVELAWELGPITELAQAWVAPVLAAARPVAAAVLQARLVPPEQAVPATDRPGRWSSARHGPSAVHWRNNRLGRLP